VRAQHDARRLFYGWNMVAVAFVVDFIAVGFFFYSYGVFLKPITTEVTGDRFSASLGLTISNCVGALAAPFVGQALDRFPIKRIMIVGAWLVGCGFFSLSLMTAKWQFYLVMGSLLALGMSMMGGIASAKLVANWFSRMRGRALGMATVGVSLSGLVMPIAATWLIASVGWRHGFQVFAALTLLIVIPLVSIFVVDRPEDRGEIPDGGFTDPAVPIPDVSHERHWRTRELLRSWTFWAIALPFSLALSGLSAILIHLFAYATDLGISEYRAAAILSLAAGAGALGKVVFGWMVDRTDSRVAVWTSLAGQLVGVGMFLSGDGYAWILAAAAVFGFSMGGVIPLHGSVIAEAFGRLSFGKASGLLRPVQMPIHFLGVSMSGWIYDQTGSYTLVFQIFAGFYVAAIVFTTALRLPRRRPSVHQVRTA